jgi:hypothetical protein
MQKNIKALKGFLFGYLKEIFYFQIFFLKQWVGWIGWISDAQKISQDPEPDSPENLDQDPDPGSMLWVRKTG